MSNPHVTVGEHKISVLQTSSTLTVRVNNLERVTEVSFKDLEIFPGKKITVLVKSLPSHALNGFKYTVIRRPGPRTRTRTFITDRERLLSLELLAGKDVDPPSLAGKIRLARFLKSKPMVDSLSLVISLSLLFL